MGKDSKLIYVLIIFLIISVIIMPSIIGGSFNKGKNVKANSEGSTAENNEPATPTELYKYTTDFLNMRTGPGTEFDIILTISANEVVKVIDHEEGWDKVIYKGTTGYCSEAYLITKEIEDDIDEGDTSTKDLGYIRVIEYMKEIDGILIVNKNYGLPKDYYPGENEEAKSQLSKMFKDAKKATKKELVVISGFRSYNYQSKLYNENKVGNDKEYITDNTALPGHSEHQTGLAFDIGGSMKSWLDESFGETEEGIWLFNNAHKYGFILRYPKDKTDITGYAYEPWHYRYVGVKHAKAMFKGNLTLEEYLLGNKTL